MKYILNLLILLLILTGCAKQSPVVIVDVKKVKEQSPAVIVDAKKLKKQPEPVAIKPDVLIQIPKKEEVIEIIPKVSKKEIKEKVIVKEEAVKEETVEEDVVEEDVVEEEIVEEKVVEEEKVETFKIAVLFSSKIVGKYAVDATNTVLSYLTYGKVSFELEVVDCKSESKINLQNSIASLYEKGFNKVIALLTKEGLHNLANLDNLETFKFYLPLINKNSTTIDNENFIFGGIDYKNQLEKLLEFSGEKIVEFHDNSIISKELLNLLENSNANIILKKDVTYSHDDYKMLFKDNKKVSGSTIFLNTPIIKSSIILSQLRYYDVATSYIVSTQLNYTPLVLSLTQIEDRGNFIISNSIGKTDDNLIEINKLLESDLIYNWVNYSVLVGIDYFLTNNSSSLVSNSVSDNQVLYDIVLYKSGKFSLEKF